MALLSSGQESPLRVATRGDASCGLESSSPRLSCPLLRSLTASGGSVFGASRPLLRRNTFCPRTLQWIPKWTHPQILLRRQINKCSEADAAVLASRSTPVTINPDLTEEEALWGQFELVCCDAVSIYLRSEVIEQNDHSYLWPLFKKVSESSEFRPATVSITQVPATESGDKFLAQFVGSPAMNRAFPMTLMIPFKKARIMEHWATRVGPQMKMEFSDAEV